MSPSHSPRSSNDENSPLLGWPSDDQDHHQYLHEPLDYGHSLSQRGLYAIPAEQRGLYAIPAEEDLPIQLPAGNSGGSHTDSSSFAPWNPSYQGHLRPLGLGTSLASLPFDDDRTMPHIGSVNTSYHPLDYSPHPRQLPQIHVDTSQVDIQSATHRTYGSQLSPLDMRSNGLHSGSNLTYSSPSSTASLPPITPIASPMNSNTPFLNASPVSPSHAMMFDGQQSVSYDPRSDCGLRKTVAELAQAHALPQDGIFVPQKTYKPHTQSDRRRYVEEVDLEEPIMFFTQQPAGCGIPLRDALNSKFIRLVGRDDLMFQNRGPSVSIRLMWPGYAPWSRQIPTRDFRSPPGPITRSKLAKNVAKTVQRFIDEMESRRLEDEAEARWRVGKNHIKLDDLLLVGLQHVSMGSWQAYVRLLPRH
ncbi:hypothetical protein CERSUDRAFT_112624 [Gelatoporia subvermispora B]|uniref:Uncharacterized protein n=1 Tax=Ceriporiopsis subvermispora (strain B) TaxID=914234 RepID=M2RJG6_CERS8|nr:hypothetical protein CERSUDRAFT_112624 [Gelatoporia subvermispora B]